MLVTLALAAAISMVAAGTALAQGSSARGYGGTGGNVQGELGPGAVAPLTGGGSVDPSGAGGDVGPAGSGGPTAEADSGSLPFTGLDLALLVGGGVLLVATGATLARVSRHRGADTNPV